MVMVVATMTAAVVEVIGDLRKPPGNSVPPSPPGLPWGMVMVVATAEAPDA